MPEVRFIAIAVSSFKACSIASLLSSNVFHNSSFDGIGEETFLVGGTGILGVLCAIWKIERQLCIVI